MSARRARGRRALRRGDRGAVALEFALLLPVITLIMTGVADYGTALQQIIRLENAARAGAQVAMTKPGDASEIRTMVLAQLTDWTRGTNCGTANQAPNGVCVTSSVTCKTTLAATGTVPCNTDFTTDWVQYASVTVTRPYAPLLLVPQTMLRGNVELRLR